MVLGVSEALAAAVLYGLATVLQALAARASAPVEGADPRLVIRLLRSWRFVLGTGLDVLGFLFVLAASRSIPLFAVQAIISANLAVTALTAAVFLRVRLSDREWLAVLVVSVGLSLVGLAAKEQGPAHIGWTFHAALLFTAFGLTVLTLLASRVHRLGRPEVIATLSGLQFGVVALASRVINGFSFGQLISDPASYALALAGAFGFFAHTAAVQRGSVTPAVAAVVVSETLFPAIVGVIVLGDTPRHGYIGPAAGGFAAALGGALSLAKYGDVEEHVTVAPQARGAGRGAPGPARTEDAPPSGDAAAPQADASPQPEAPPPEDASPPEGGEDDDRGLSRDNTGAWRAR